MLSVHPMQETCLLLARSSEFCPVNLDTLGLQLGHSAVSYPMGRSRTISSGGDVATTNEIIHEVSVAKSKGIPVIACLGNMAASAGYDLAGQHHGLFCLLFTS